MISSCKYGKRVQAKLFLNVKIKKDIHLFVCFFFLFLLFYCTQIVYFLECVYNSNN